MVEQCGHGNRRRKAGVVRVEVWTSRCTGARKNFVAARPHLQRAARFEPLREEAICLMAEASLCAGRAGEALYALNTLLMEQDQGREAAIEVRVRLLRRGSQGACWGGRWRARRELAAIPKSQASVDELLAAAQACILSEDFPGKRSKVSGCWMRIHWEGARWRRRVRLCRAAIDYRTGRLLERAFRTRCRTRTIARRRTQRSAGRFAGA